MRREGFTLIELLVVVLIIGILASVAMPQYFKSVEKSRSAEAINIANALAEAQSRFYMKTGTYGYLSDNDFDVDFANLQYFTVTNAGGTDGHTVIVTRNSSAGGGLGAYEIYLALPFPPGSGARTWDCSPVGAGCRSMLPQ